MILDAPPLARRFARASSGRRTYHQQRCSNRDGFNSLRQHGRYVAVLVLLTYASLLLQPCAMAMGSEPTQHPASCHHGSSVVGAGHCQSQSMAECDNGDWSFDGRVPVAAQFAGQFAVASSEWPAQSERRPDAVSMAQKRGPPRGQPALNIRNCVFLK